MEGCDWHAGLANARVTIFGDVYQLPNDLQEAAREIFLQKQVSTLVHLFDFVPRYKVAYTSAMRALHQRVHLLDI